MKKKCNDKKECKIIYLYTYKSKEQKEIEAEFRALSDHIINDR